MINNISIYTDSNYLLILQSIMALLASTWRSKDLSYISQQKKLTKSLFFIL
jgi:ribonuclease HI